MHFKMYVRCQMYIFLALIYLFFNVLANETGPCECDVLQINDSSDVIGFQIFTKQNDTRNDKPYYISVSPYPNRISWNGQYWSYEVYNKKFKIFESRRNYSENSFSFERNCENSTLSINRDTGE